jgi:hypothetical protein
MAAFDYQHAKAEIVQINAIVETCPDAVKEKCFELLFVQVFGKPFAAPPPPERQAAPKPEEPEKPTPPQAKKLPHNVIAFMRKNNVTEDELGKLFMIDHEPLLAIYKLPTGKQAQAQLYKVLMILLENGLLNNSLSAPYTELRDSVKEDGLMDGNFNGTLKRNHAYFRGAITENGIEVDGTVELSGTGMEKLAEIVKELSTG